MKLTKNKLRRMIKEELQAVFKEEQSGELNEKFDFAALKRRWDELRDYFSKQKYDEFDFTGPGPEGEFQGTEIVVDKPEQEYQEFDFTDEPPDVIEVPKPPLRRSVRAPRR